MKKTLHIAVVATMILALSGMGNKAFAQFLHQKKEAPIHVEKYACIAVKSRQKNRNCSSS